MKRTIAFLLTVILVFSIIPCTAACAEEEPVYTDVIRFEDGSFAVVTITQDSLSSAPSLRAKASSSVKNGSKTFTYYGSDGAAKWAATLNASFTYNGSTSSCTAANCTVSIYNSSWYTISNSSTHSGNTATANVTMGHKLAGVTIEKKTASITLSCDANGNLS